MKIALYLSNDLAKEEIKEKERKKDKKIKERLGRVEEGVLRLLIILDKE